MSKKKKIGNFIFLLAVFCITIYYVLHGRDIAQLIAYIHSANQWIWILCVICVLLFIISESVIIWYLLHCLGQNIPFSSCCMYSFVGFFFSCVTPGASGGQPMQLVFMKRDRIPISVSTLVLLIVTITYKAVLIILGTIVFIVRPQSVMIHLQPVINWCYLGYILNVLVVIGMLFLVFWPELVVKLVCWLDSILRHVKWYHDRRNIQQRVVRAAGQYKTCAYFFRQHVGIMLQVLVLTIIQRIFLFLVTYLTCVSFHVLQNQCVVVTTLQGMISVIVDILPLPGGMGITEKMFADIFSPMLLKATLAVLIVSRTLSYYTELLISAVFTVIGYFKMRRE